MHPDRKIGIAMGILLVGVVAALFFRNEPLAVDGGLSLERENDINQRLRDRDVTVFLEDQTSADDDSNLSQPNWSLPEMLGDLRTNKDEVPIPIGGRGVPLQPVAVEPVVSQNESTAEVDSGLNDEVETPAAAVQKAAGSDPDAEMDFVEYTVQFGDTLSELSQRFLGSQARFREIYEANKDRMDSPDRLRVGKAIRIPRVIR